MKELVKGWIAMNSDGRWFWYENMPVLKSYGDYLFWKAYGWSRNLGIGFKDCSNPKDSLQEYTIEE